jgi:hypothetical protein
VGSKTGTWCGKCPKCLFTFIILSPFLASETLTGIFGRNLLNDPGMEEIFGQLSGISPIKPFECIGTVDEVNLAMDKAIAMYPPGDIPFLLRAHQAKSRGAITPESYQVRMHHLDSLHFVPGKYMSLLKSML